MCGIIYKYKGYTVKLEVYIPGRNSWGVEIAITLRSAKGNPNPGKTPTAFSTAIKKKKGS